MEQTLHYLQKKKKTFANQERWQKVQYTNKRFALRVQQKNWTNEQIGMINMTLDIRCLPLEDLKKSSQSISSY